MTAQDIVNYVVTSAQLVDACHEKLQKQASEIAQLKQLGKKASAFSLDENKLMKAANDMHTIYGKPSSVTPEKIAEYWRQNPNTLLDTFCKLASAQMEHSVNGEHIGSARQEVPHQKKAAASVVTGTEDAATAAFWSNYKDR